MDDEVKQSLQLPVVNDGVETMRNIISVETVSYVNIEVFLVYENG